jgi:hypothetical protein
MGLDDREYMRERRRRESGARLGSASWIDKKGRLEHHDLWFDAKEVHFACGPASVAEVDLLAFGNLDPDPNLRRGSA